MPKTILSGGGLTSNKLKQIKASKVEPRAKAISPEAAGQQGSATAFVKRPLVSGSGYQAGAMGPTGIANARQGPSGPGPGGGSRMIYKSGSQSPTPAPKEMEKGHDILRDYGKDYRR